LGRTKGFEVDFLPSVEAKESKSRMKTKVVSQVLQIALAILVFLFPLAFLPFLADPYDLGKMVFLFSTCFLVFAVWTIESLVSQKLVYKKSHYLLPGFVLLGVFLLSTLVNSSNKMGSLAFATGAGSLLTVLTFYFLLTNLGKRRLVLYSLMGSGAVLSLGRLILFLTNFSAPKEIAALNLVLSKTWSPTGNLLSGVVFLLLLLPIGFALIYEEIKQKRLTQAAILFLINTLNLSGLAVGYYLLSTVAKPVILPQDTAWAIALETLKNFRFALLGLAPGQFINAFTSFRSLAFNSTDFWNLRFSYSSNWYLQVLTETGLAGLVAYLLLAGKVVKDAIKVFRQSRISYLGLAAYLSLIILFIAQLFLPLNFFLLGVMFVLLAVCREEDQVTAELGNLGGFVYLFLIFPLAFWGTIAFFGGKITQGSYYFLNSLKAINKNDGVAAYNFQIKAIGADPSSPTYRIAYAQTNFALANNLAAKQDLTDTDRSTISQLIQQAIREAKAAVAVDPRSASGWENLANLYRNLINFAEGASDWSISAYQEAINLDPLNPVTRIDLGGLYYSQKNWQNAANLFAQAANLKSDLANAHYNLANALREMGDLASAKKEYEVAQSLVPVDTNDYQKVSQELEEVKKRIPTPTPAPGGNKAIAPETLSTAKPPTNGINPRLELPNEGPVVTGTP